MFTHPLPDEPEDVTWYRFRSGWIPESASDRRTVEDEKCHTASSLKGCFNEQEELKRSLDAVQARINVLHTRMDMLYGLDAPVRRLPAEILQEVFLHYLPIWDEEHAMQPSKRALLQTPITLASVCVTWRSTALSFPKLWSKIRLDVSSLQMAYRARNVLFESSEGKAAVLELHLARSKTHPLSVIMRGYPDTPPANAMWKKLCDTSLRWHHFIYSDKKDMHPTHIHPRGLMNLQSLELPFHVENIVPGQILGKWLTTYSLPALRTILAPLPDITLLTNANSIGWGHSPLQEIRLSGLKGPLPRIGARLAPAVFQKIMAALPRSVTVLQILGSLGESSPGREEPPVVLPGISHFSIVLEKTKSRHIFHVLDLPYLVSLDISITGNIDAKEPIYKDIVSFLSRYKSQTSSLVHLTLNLRGLFGSFSHLTKGDSPFQTLRDMLSKVPNLETLSIQDPEIRASAVNIVTHVLRGDVDPLVPNLRSFKLGILPRDLQKAALGALLDIIDFRFHARGLKHVALLFATPTGSLWSIPSKLLDANADGDDVGVGWPFELPEEALLEILSRIMKLKAVGLDLTLRSTNEV